MKILTSSSLSCFRTCPRKYFYAYEMARVKVSEAAPLAFGKAAHSALAAWWGAPKGEELKAAVEKLKEVAAGVDGETSSRLAAIIGNYHPPKDDFDVLAIEEPFEMKIENPDGGRAFYGYRLAGKIDLMLKHRMTGKVFIVDHKTTSKEIIGFGAYWQALQIDSQMSNYCLAKDAAGFIYDVVKKPTIKLCGKDEKVAQSIGTTPEDVYQDRCSAAMAATPDEYYQWREHPKNESDSKEAWRDLWQWAEMFRQCDVAGRFPRNCGACVGMFGSCQYIDVCTGRASIDDDSLFRTKAEANEELLEV